MLLNAFWLPRLSFEKKLGFHSKKLTNKETEKKVEKESG